MGGTSARHVLVLGGTGFLGREITEAFLAAGSSVTIVARRQPVDRWHLDQVGVEMVPGDAGDPALLAPLIDRADHVVHAVGATLPAESNVDPASDVTSTLAQLLSLLEVLRGRTGTGLTYLSSGGTVYGNPQRNPVRESSLCEPITSYGITKLAAEKYIGMYATLYGVAARILRVGNAYGPLQPAGRSQGLVGALMAAARRGQPVRVFGDGRTVRDYVHVDDVARAAVALAAQPEGPRVVNVGCGVGHSVLEVVETFSRLADMEVPVERLPARGFDVRTVVLDVRLLSSLIRWDPVPFEVGVAQTWHALAHDAPTFEPVA